MNTTEEQKQIQAVLATIAGHAVKGEIAAWNRKRKSIERIVGNNIRPIEDQIIEANAKLLPLYDQLKTMRNEMVEFCIHPIDMMVHKGDHVECKFCSAKMAVPTKMATECTK